jgi:hypothetical protein
MPRASAPFAAWNTSVISMPAWRSDRSTILRMTEESSTIRARMLFMKGTHFISPEVSLVNSPVPHIGREQETLKSKGHDAQRKVGCRTELW